MNLSKKSILKLIIIVSTLYFVFISIISTFFNQNKCQTTDRWAQVVTQSPNKITFILIEFEFFENDLIDTSLSICKLWTNNTILIVSQKPIYPPIVYPNGTLLAECDIRFIETDFEINRRLMESQIEWHIKTEYVVIIPDAIRLKARHKFDHSVRYLQKLNSLAKTALIIPIDSGFDVSNRNSSSRNDNCLQIEFDIKRWTLRYRRSDSLSSCDAFEGNEYAILMTTNHLLELNRPFVRPFIHSFFIQCKGIGIKVKIFDKIVFEKGIDLFDRNERNKWKHKLWTEERRKSLFDMFGIKKVIDPNGSVEWFGCTKETTRCFPTVVNEMPDYLFANRWTPVCCLHNLAKTGRHVFETLEAHSVRYWLEGGSLLGAVRNGTIIPWDYDIDIGVYLEDIKKCPHFNQKNAIIDEKGFVWEKAKEGDFYRVQFSPSNRLHVDIFPFYSVNGTMTKNTWFESHIQDKEFPEHYLQPLTRIPFIEWNAFAPNNVKEFLEFKFGKNVIQNPKYPKPEVLQFSNKDSIS